MEREKNNAEISTECFPNGNGSLLLDSKENANTTSRCGVFYTYKLFKEVFKVLEVFWGASSRHVLVETTTGS